MESEIVNTNFDPTAPPEDGQRLICNRCGKVLDFWDISQDFHIHTYLGYGSIHDEDILDYRLCCDCIDAVITECAVSPIETVKEEE